MIILTFDQANQVRGLTVLGHAIAPKPFVASGASNAAFNGNLGLPEACISDPFHGKFSVFLQTLPTVPDNSIVGTDWSIDATLLAECTYSQVWAVGAIQPVLVPA